MKQLVTMLTFWLLIVWCGNGEAYSQENWLRKAGGNNLDEYLDVAVSPVGKYYSVGYFSGNASFQTGSLVSAGMSDAVAVAYNNMGEPEWAKRFGGSGTDRATAVACTNSEIVVAGFFFGTATFGDFQLTAADSGDVFVAKLNSFGDVLWAKSAGGIYGDAAYGVSVATNGEVFVTGEFRGQAQFGSNTVNSMNWEGSSTPSPDIFIAKLSSSGDWQWVKTGSSDGADRGMDIALDNAGNCYVTGQFSNDITFDNLYPNTIVNAGFLVKYSGSGTEQWMVKMGATQVLPYAVDVEGSDVYVAGESIGQMIYFASNSLVVPALSNYSGFLAKFSSAGSVVWGVEDGSSSYVSFRDLDVFSGKVYLGGVFQCAMDEYALELGLGLFHAVGYKDSFAASYSSSGEREWMRQYGGPKDDVCLGVAVAGIDDVVMAGSFEKIFNVPNANNAFTANPTNFTPSGGNQYVYPNGAGPMCGYSNYGSFIHVSAAGNRDMYVGRLFDVLAPHYDFYSRDDCQFGIEEPCIGTVNQPLMCEEEATGCGEVRVYGLTNTGSNCFIGPEYDMEWQNGSQALFQDVEVSGWVTWSVAREDGCASYMDSMYVEVLPLPVPLVTDDQGINFEEEPNATDIELCAPDEVVLTGGSADGQSGYWSTPNGMVFSPSVTVNESGSYSYVIIGENGCLGENALGVNFIEPLTEIDPFLQFEDQEYADGDTITICGNALVNFELLDLLDQSEFPMYTDALWTLIYNGQVEIDQDDAAIEYDVYPQGNGHYQIIVEPYLHVEPPCPNDTIWYPPQTLNFYLNLLETPYINMTLTGPSTICDGETLQLVVTSDSPFTWSGPGVNGWTVDTISVTQPGAYGVNSVVEFANGCSAEETLTINVVAPASPLLTTNPGHQVICPEGSIEISSPMADAYNWIGPLGQSLGTTQSIDVSTPGSYYCVLTTGTCVLESMIIDIQAYATPYLVALPSYDLCLEGYVNLVAQVSPQAVVNWLPPLSGSSLSQNVFLPNVYSIEVTFCGITSVVSTEITQTNPEPVIQASTMNVCPGEPVLLFGPPDMEIYTWSPGNIVDDTITVYEPVTYILSVTDTNGCVGSSVPFDVTYYNISSPNPTDITVCYGQPASLFAQGGNVVWSTDANGDQVVGSGNVFNTPPIWSNSTWYVYREDANCRSVPEPVLVSVTPSSVAYISTEQTEWCAGTEIQISANNPNAAQTQYHWQTPTGVVNNQGTLTLNNAQGAQSGWYVLTVTGGGCESVPDSLLLFIEEPNSTGWFSSEEEGVCRNGDLQLIPNVVMENMYWETPSGLVMNEVVSVSNASESDMGWYIVHGDGVICSSVYDSVFVSVREYPVIDLQAEDVYCDQGYMVAHLPEGYDLYHWNTGDIDADAIVPLDGWLYVTVTNYPSCAVTDSIYVSEIDCISEFPNVFTPNGDGSNDYVDFGWLRIPIDEVHIYNRWGNLIRHLTGEPFIWNGRNDEGELVSDAAYFYVVGSSNPSGQLHNVEGYIHVLGSAETTNGQ
jgi:gliding motility-associated-like protein